MYILITHGDNDVNIEKFDNMQEINTRYNSFWDDRDIPVFQYLNETEYILVDRY